MDQREHSRKKVRLPLGEVVKIRLVYQRYCPDRTVGFCSNAPAGPITKTCRLPLGNSGKLLFPEEQQLEGRSLSSGDPLRRQCVAELTTGQAKRFLCFNLCI